MHLTKVVLVLFALHILFCRFVARRQIDAKGKKHIDRKKEKMQCLCQYKSMYDGIKKSVLPALLIFR